MEINQRKLVLSGMLLLGLPFAYGPLTYAAKAVDLDHQRISVLQPFISTKEEAVNIKEINRSIDFKQTLHVRIQEMYAGYPVWGADAVVHIPNGLKIDKSISAVVNAAASGNGSMDGTFYLDLHADLAKAPAAVFSKEQAQKVLQSAIETYQHKVGAPLEVQDKQSKLIVFVDSSHKAHWAYQVSFYVAPTREDAAPSIPVYIIDAMTSHVYAEWNDIKNLENAEAPGGGFGGNKKMGEVVYDGLPEHLPKLKFIRDDGSKTCYMKNADVTVKNYKDSKVMNFACNTVNSDHNSVYWHGDADAVNGGYSPSDDALFGGAVIKDMYQKWYNIPVLVNQDGTPMMLNMVVHYPRYDNAYWDGKQMVFGDGASLFYPLTSLGVAAHEISHGFTQQHSNLSYYSQSGGMNESFSDMAAQAAEFYAYGKNSWQIGPEIFKAENEALRYMDKPSKDCKGDTPGNWCSIDHISQYRSGLDVHYSSGIYNRVFYLLGTAEGWDTKKAFDVMVQANNHYWTSSTNFAKGACGVLKAAKDHNFDTKAVVGAFAGVGIDTKDC